MSKSKKREERRRRSSSLRSGGFLGAAVLTAGLLVAPPAFAEDAVTPFPTPEGKSSVVQKTPENTEAPPAAGRAAPEAKPKPEATARAAAATISLTVSQLTGTGPFDGDDSPGHDSSATNDIVRTNDTVEFELGVRVGGADQTNTTVHFQVPQGQELVTLPPFCEPGSTVTPQSLPAPVVPLTANSWRSLPSQTVECILKPQPENSSFKYSFVTRVRPEVPNGTVMDPVVFEVHSDQVTEPARTEPLTQKVSSVPQFDLSKRVAAAQPNQGPLFQNTRACVDDPSRVCRVMAYPVSITAPSGGKGTAPLTSPISFEDNLDPASFYGADVWAQMVAKAGSESAAIAKYAPRFAGCSPIGPGSGFKSSLPYSKISGTTATSNNSVRDTGAVNCDSPGPGQNATITLTNTDTSLLTSPATTGSGNALPSGLGFIASLELGIHVPQDAILDFGGGDEGVYTLDTHNEYTNVKMTGIDGSANIGDDPSNNDRDASTRLQLDGSFDKAFTGIFGTAGNTPAMDFSGSFYYQGLPGSGKIKDGNTVVMPGQSVQSILQTGNQGIAGSGELSARTMVSCDVWDPTRLALAANPAWHGHNASMYPSNGKPVFVSFFRGQDTNWSASSIDTPNSGVKNLKIEYSSGPGGPGADSDCSTGTWVADPSNVPGATTNVDSQGRTVWTGVNRVRVTYNTDYPAGTTFGGFNIDFAIGQVVLDSSSTEPIGNWGSQMYLNGVKTTAEVIADPKRTDRVPSYDPKTHKGSLGDRLIQGEAIARVKKFIQDPSSGEFVDQVVPQFTSGSTVRYRLDPSLTTSVPVAGNKAKVIVEDCLPKYQVFRSSKQGTNPLTPSVVQMGAPAGAELTCAADQQYIKWDLGDRSIGEAIEPITVEAEILDVARNGVYTNNVLVSSPADNSPASLRDDNVQLQLVVPTGIKISKTVDKPQIEVNPKGVTNPRTVLWSVMFANVDSPTDVSNVDVIDVLPSNGLNGNSFHGELKFDSAKVKAGSGISLFYTKAPASNLNSDPSDTSNGTSGSTVWCDAVGGSIHSGNGTSANCPQSSGEVTGLRFIRTGLFEPDDKFQIDIAMTPVGNTAGDVYRNITSGRADGVPQGVGPASRTVDVVASSIGDRVWEDLNKNGVQDAGEPGVAGFPVHLSGEDVDGNKVELSTTTDADGKYLFTNLASGKYRVVFDPSGLNSNSKFTTQHAGADPKLDSDADQNSGETQQIDLGVSEENLTLDAGLVIDHNVQIVLAKKFLRATALDSENRSTVTYELLVTNQGTAEGKYDLKDKLRFGGNVAIDSASVRNETPGSITTNPKFDGQANDVVVSQVSLPGGSSHKYLVTVKSTVSTSITRSETDCTVTTTENGSGFLNEAELTMNGVSVKDKACGEVPTPPKPNKPSLPITGGQDSGALFVTVLLLLAAGGSLLMFRRKRATK